MPTAPETRLRAAAEPVQRIPTDPPRDAGLAGTALCLSGGGYRAMLFHLGAVWRLYETGLLAELDRVSSVSGGSITAATLGMNWEALNPASPDRDKFEVFAVKPIRSLAGRTIDISSVLGGLFTFGTSAQKLPAKYDKLLFGGRTLQDLPDRPRFVINATNVQSGALWRFSKPYMWDWRVGKVPNPKLSLATAVAASSSCPPFLSPFILDFKESDYEPDTGADLQKPPFTTRVFLTDGGVYDNLGLETAWKRHRRILVSDGGGQMMPEAVPSARMLPHIKRVTDLIDNQVRSLRKRQLIGSYVDKTRDGAYWGIRSDIVNYGLPDVLPCPEKATLALADVPTRLAAVEPRLQERLINWGYAVCDAAVRAHVMPGSPPAQGFPYPGSGV